MNCSVEFGLCCKMGGEEGHSNDELFAIIPHRLIYRQRGIDCVGCGMNGITTPNYKIHAREAAMMMKLKR